MKKNSSMLVAVLTLTAIVLGVILLAAPTRQAQAVMLDNENGVVMMTAGQGSGADELLIIMDKSTGKILIYRLNGNNLELLSNADVTGLFNPATR